VVVHFHGVGGSVLWLLRCNVADGHKTGSTVIARGRSAVAGRATSRLDRLHGAEALLKRSNTATTLFASSPKRMREPLRVPPAPLCGESQCWWLLADGGV
jgi:hypothetical protein